MLKYNIEVKVWSEKNLTKCVAAAQGDEKIWSYLMTVQNRCGQSTELPPVL